MNLTRKIALPLLLTTFVLLALCAATSARAEEEKPVPVCTEPLSAGHPFSCKGYLRQVGRGLVNVACCWTEIPYEIKRRLDAKDNLEMLGVFTNTYNVVAGTAAGAFHTVTRCVGGIYEVTFAPFPPYDPLMCPAYPPYMFCGCNLPAKIEGAAQPVIVKQ